MKSVVIVYDQPLSYVQGVNYVNNSFVLGQDIFISYGFQLLHIVSPKEIFVVGEHQNLDLIGSKSSGSQSTITSGLRLFLRRFCSSEHLIFAYAKMYFGYIRYAKKTIDNLKKLPYKPDFIIFQDCNTAYHYFKTEKNPAFSILILHCSDDYLEQAKGSYPGYYKYAFLEKRRRKQFDFVFSKVKKVVYLSNHAVNASYLPEHLKICIPNGVKDNPDTKVRRPDGILQFTCVGTVSEHKGQFLIIHALTILHARILERIHLHIIGGGDELEKCKSFVKAHHLESHVTFYGIRNDVVRLLEKMDVFILPSLSEGMPMSILEAMRQGLYILATETGAIPEMIKPEFGQHITRNPSEIAEIITDLVENGTVSYQAKVASRNYFMEHYTVESMIGTYAKLLASL